MTEHERIKQLISAYFDGSANSEEEKLVLDHLKDCQECQKYWQDLKTMSSSLKLWQDETLSPDQEQEILKKLESVKEREGLTMKKKTYTGKCAKFIPRCC